MINTKLLKQHSKLVEYNEQREIHHGGKKFQVQVWREFGKDPKYKVGRYSIVPGEPGEPPHYPAVLIETKNWYNDFLISPIVMQHYCRMKPFFNDKEANPKLDEFSVMLIEIFLSQGKLDPKLVKIAYRDCFKPTKK